MSETSKFDPLKSYRTNDLQAPRLNLLWGVSSSAGIGLVVFILFICIFPSFQYFVEDVLSTMGLGFVVNYAYISKRWFSTMVASLRLQLEPLPDLEDVSKNDDSSDTSASVSNNLKKRIKKSRNRDLNDDTTLKQSSGAGSMPLPFDESEISSTRRFHDSISSKEIIHKSSDSTIRGEMNDNCIQSLSPPFLSKVKSELDVIPDLQISESVANPNTAAASLAKRILTSNPRPSYWLTYDPITRSVKPLSDIQSSSTTL